MPKATHPPPDVVHLRSLLLPATARNEAPRAPESLAPAGQAVPRLALNVFAWQPDRPPTDRTEGGSADQDQGL